MNMPMLVFRKPITSRTRAGMSLVEVVISIGIFAVIALMGLYTLASSVSRNRSTELTVASTLLARQVIEEVISLSESSASSQAVGADAQSNYCRPLELIKYLLSDNVPDGYEVTREGGSYLSRVVCKFPAMQPGYAMRDSSGEMQYPYSDGTVENARSTVTMVLYLDEGDIPMDLSNPLPKELWDDLSTTGTPPTRTGIDINGDGKITTGGFLTNSTNPSFTRPNIGTRYKRITHLPIDVIVDYTISGGKGSSQESRVAQISTYRVIITDFSNLD
jgi:hypothetical protein